MPNVSWPQEHKTASLLRVCPHSKGNVAATTYRLGQMSSRKQRRQGLARGVTMTIKECLERWTNLMDERR